MRVLGVEFCIGFYSDFVRAFLVFPFSVEHRHGGRFGVSFLFPF
jgi:hypothetical protein